MAGDITGIRAMRPRDGDSEWFCPLYERDIPEGLCIEINYDRVGYTKGHVLAEVEEATGNTASQVNQACEGCPNFPFRGEDPKIRR